MKTERLTDVIIEERSSCLEVWANKNMKSLIESVEGVDTCSIRFGSRCNYHVYLDPRYDREFVMKEIEAVIKIGDL